MADDWPYPGLADTPNYRRLAADRKYARLFARLYGPGASPVVVEPTRKPCVSLDERVIQRTGHGCGGDIRYCTFFDEPCVTLGPSPVPHWCDHCEEREDRV